MPSNCQGRHDATCDAIPVAQSGIGGKGMKDAKGSLEKTSEEDIIDFEHRALEGKIAAWKQDNMALEAKITLLEECMSRLTGSVDAYNKVQRNSFISTYKQTKSGGSDDKDNEIIKERKLWEHEGDAAFDAHLYQGTDGRRDYSTFMKLYGFPPETVQRITHKETIGVLNTYAKVVASNHRVGSEKFHRLFAEFVKLFKESGKGYEESYLDGNPTDVTRAYRAFLDCIKDEVTNIDSIEACN